MSNVISTAVSKTLNVVLAQGSAVFNNADNSITLKGIGKDIEIGDVIQISGEANAKNNSEFTVEVITNDNNIIVNQAHAGKTSSKALVSETATVTVKLLCKWYLASDSLGRGWVNLQASRNSGTEYTNNTGRPYEVLINQNSTDTGFKRFTLSFGESGNFYGLVTGDPTSNADVTSSLQATILNGQYYIHNRGGTGSFTIESWFELR